MPVRCWHARIGQTHPIVVASRARQGYGQSFKREMAKFLNEIESGIGNSAEIDEYSTEFRVVPEPGTALLQAVSLTALVLLRRSRPAATRETA